MIAPSDRRTAVFGRCADSLAWNAPPRAKSVGCTFGRPGCRSIGSGVRARRRPRLWRLSPSGITPCGSRRWTRSAEALGLEIGLPLAAARARVPELVVREADPAADAAFLAAIGEVCRRYTPAFALDPPDGVHLDISGTETLFGGEAALIDDLLRPSAPPGDRRADRSRSRPPASPGPSPGTAILIAILALPPSRDLPVAALRLDPAESLGVLHRLGLRRVGQILDLPRATLGAPAGRDALLLRLDEILGRRAAAFDLSCPSRLSSSQQHRLAEPIAPGGLRC